LCIPIFLFPSEEFLSSKIGEKNKFFFQITQEEKKELEHFFNYVFFENWGIFVLFGSKPMVEVSLIDFDSMDFEGKETKVNKAIRVLHNPYKGFLVWEKFKDYFKIDKYIVGTLNNPVFGETFLVVDIKKLALVIADHYEVFKKAVGFDFDPLEMVFDIQNPDSTFWNTVFELDNHVTKGLIFGYGKKNSYFFQWKNQNNEQKINNYLKNVSLYPSTTCDAQRLTKGNISNFSIPFFYYVEGDQTVKIYETEKKEIEKTFRKKDIVEVILQRLTD